MTGLFERSVGTDWHELHPQIQERYGIAAAEERTAVGTGEMSRLTSNVVAFPALWLGTVDDFLFPEGGSDIPFRMTSDAFIDGDGREALFLNRHFGTDPPRNFVDTLRWNPERDCITNLFGRTGHLAADLHSRVDDGTLVLELGKQWLRVGGRYLTVPRPLAVTGSVRDWYDDAAGEFNVAIDVQNPLVGRIFGCRGQFQNELRPTESVAGSGSVLGGVKLPRANA